MPSSIPGAIVIEVQRKMRPPSRPRRNPSVFMTLSFSFRKRTPKINTTTGFKFTRIEDVPEVMNSVLV
jgi:hypothetical protein